MKIFIKLLTHRSVFLTAIGLSVGFLVNGQDCSKQLIKGERDKFNGTKTIMTPVFNNVTVGKIINDTAIKYILSVSIQGATLNSNPKGMYLFFDDGTKFFDESAEVNVDVVYGNYEYTASLIVPEKLVQDLSVKRITDFKVDIHSKEIKEKDGKKMMCYCAAILKSN